MRKPRAYIHWSAIFCLHPIMNRNVILKFCKLTVLTSAAAAMLVACSKKSDTSGHDKNDALRHGKSAAAAKNNGTGAKCAAHNAPKELCFICDASLREKGRLWCKEHSRYEDRCWECHPELQEKNRPWCKEHSLYEDECFLCRPELKKTPKADAQSGARSAVLMCREHGVPEAECGICHPELAGKLEPGAGAKVRLTSRESAGMAGVQLATPTVGTIADTVECYAELTFNQNKTAQIAAPVSGILQEVSVDVGSRVNEGQPLAKIWSASIAEAAAKAVLSHQTLNRERKLMANGAISEKDLQQAEANHRAVCHQLRVLGFSEEYIDALESRPHEQVFVEMRAPFAGEIIERAAVRGALVEAGKSLFTVVDRSVMWAMLNIPETALARVKEGQTLELRVESLPGRTFTGTITWIGAELDEKSRMARARAEVANPDGLLKSKMFAQACIFTRRAENALLLPDSAVQWIDGGSFVFVKQAEDLFEARRVRLGARRDGKVEIMEGLMPEETVVVNHAFILKSAMLISRLGAGCAGD